MAASQNQRGDTPKKTSSPARFKGIPRSPARFKQREVARAVRAAQQAGGVARVELAPDGHINIILASQAPVTDDKNSWDEVLTDAANEKRPA